MSYAVITSASARSALRTLPFEVGELVLDQLELLLENPVLVGRRDRLLYGFGMFVRCPPLAYGPTIYHVVLRYCYLPTRDENQLGLFAIDTATQEGTSGP